MIESLIYERERNQTSATEEISAKWGGRQTLVCPVVSVPYYEFVKNDSNKLERVVRFMHFLPDVLTVTSDVFPEKRYRSFYEVVVYNSKIHFDGTFSGFSGDNFGVKTENILFQNAFIAVGITDLRGIEEQIKLTWNNAESYFNSGVETADVIQSGIHSPVQIGRAHV